MASANGEEWPMDNIQRDKQNTRICTPCTRICELYSPLFLTFLYFFALCTDSCLFHFFQQGITLVLINLDGNTTTEVVVTTKSAFVWSLKHHNHSTASNTKFNHVPRTRKTNQFTREEYHLTAPSRNLHSRIMLLNGKVLAADQNGNITKLEPIKVDGLGSTRIAPFSIVFAHIPYFHAPACR